MNMKEFNNQIIRDFRKSKDLAGGVTDFIHFGRAVFGKKLNPRMIKKRMLQALDPADYPEFTMEELLEHFNQLTHITND